MVPGKYRPDRPQELMKALKGDNLDGRTWQARAIAEVKGCLAQDSRVEGRFFDSLVDALAAFPDRPVLGPLPEVAPSPEAWAAWAVSHFRYQPEVQSDPEAAYLAAGLGIEAGSALQARGMVENCSEAVGQKAIFCNQKPAKTGTGSGKVRGG